MSATPIVNNPSDLPMVAIVGRTNVGKSTLFNRLLKKRKAIASPAQGVTRNPVQAICEISARYGTTEPLRFLLVDTGGIGLAEGDFAKHIDAVGIEAMRVAACILFVVDVTVRTRADEECAKLLRAYSSKVILVANKVDSEAREALAWEYHNWGFNPLIPFSAEHGRGVAELEEAIVEILAQLPSFPKPAKKSVQPLAQKSEPQAPEGRTAAALSAKRTEEIALVAESALEAESAQIALHAGDGEIATQAHAHVLAQVPAHTPRGAAHQGAAHIGAAHKNNTDRKNTEDASDTTRAADAAHTDTQNDLETHDLSVPNKLTAVNDLGLVNELPLVNDQSAVNELELVNEQPLVNSPPDPNKPTDKPKIQPIKNIKVTIAGKPNAGKSTLLNAILGMEVSLVSEIPGTTRDIVEGGIDFRGTRLEFLDTAGIRRAAKVREDVEYYSVRRAIEAIETTDITLLLVDPETGITEQDKKIADYVANKGRALIFILAKWDTQKHSEFKSRCEKLKFFFPQMGWAPILSVSGKTGNGIGPLLSTIISLYREQTKVIETSRLNKALAAWLDANPPPIGKSNHFRLKYAVQLSVNPQCFAFFASRPQAVPDQYQAYLRNKIRSSLGLAHSPVLVVIRASSEGRTEKANPRKRTVLGLRNKSGMARSGRKG